MQEPQARRHAGQDQHFHGAGRKPQVTTVSTQGTIAERRRQEAQDVIDAFQAAADRAPNDGLAASQLYFEKARLRLGGARTRRGLTPDAAAVGRGPPGEHAFIQSRVGHGEEFASPAFTPIKLRKARRVPSSSAHRPVRAERAYRLGYLSADFRSCHRSSHRRHVRQARPVAFRNHRLFAWGRRRKRLPRRVVASADTFIDIQDTSDEEAAARIKQDGIDILIDLSGQIRGNRLEILALKPTPLQGAYIGFPGSNGAAFIDYMFTDKTVLPDAHLDTYSEATAYLPHCYLITDDAQPISDAPISRKSQNLPDDAIVFCSFNQGFKITPDVFDAWCEIWRGGQRPLLPRKPCNSTSQEAKTGSTANDSFSPIEFRNRTTWPARASPTSPRHRDLYRPRDDVRHALSGLPVITKLGRHFASRLCERTQSGGFTGVDHESWPDLWRSERLAPIRVARNPLGGRKSAPLFDTARSVRAMEHGFEEMWRRYLDGEAPARIDIPDR